MFSLIIYWGNCIFSMLLAKLGVLINRQKTTLLAIVSSIPIFFITAIRYDVGTDYFSYRSIFEAMQYAGPDRFEWLFYIMNRILGFFSSDPQMVFVGSALIFLICSYKQIFLDSPNPSLSIFLLMGSMIYFTYLNALRQLTGCAICFLALGYAYKRKVIPFVILIILGAGFHSICWLFLITYFFTFIKVNIKKSIILIALTIVFSQVVVGLVNTTLTDSIYRNYIIHDSDIDKLVTFVPINIAVWLFSVIFYNKENPKYKLYLNCQFAMVLLAMFYLQIPLVTRVMWLLWLPQTVLIPMALEGISSKLLRIFFIVAIVILFFVYSSYSIAVNFSHNVVPYQTIFW